MSEERPQAPQPVIPITSLEDPRAITLLTTETPYFTTPTHDDIDAVVTGYGPGSDSLAGQIIYGLTTSNGMIGLIVSMVGGVLVSVLSLLIGIGSGGLAVGIGVGVGVLVFAALVVYTFLAITRAQVMIEARFPTPEAAPASDPLGQVD